MSRQQKKSGGCLSSIIGFVIIIVLIGLAISALPVVLSVSVIIGITCILFAIIKQIFGIKSPLKNVNFDNMTGKEFEDFCAQVLRYNGFSGVSVTKGSGDHGIDILANKNGQKYAIQCKCYSENVGNKAVQEAYSGKAIYGADVAVVMTNRNFTKQAELDARKLNVQLWGRSKLQSLIIFSRDKKEKHGISNNDIESKTQIEEKPIKEKIYRIQNMTVQFTLMKHNKVSILIVDAQDEITLPCIFFYLYIELRDKYKDKYNYTINTVYQGKTVNCENEYIYGHNSDGTISRTTPDWLESARENLLKIGVENYSGIVAEIENIIDDFLNKNEKSAKSNYSKEFIENYARMCNAYLEHQDEMAQYETQNIKEYKNQTPKKEDIETLLEKELFIKEDFIQFKYTINNKIEILAICKNPISAANLYLSFYTKLKDDWIRKFNFAVAVEFEKKTAIASYENDTEFFGGMENGEIVVGIPKWLDKARDELLSGDQIVFFIEVKQIHIYLEEFIEEIFDFLNKV